MAILILICVQRCMPTAVAIGSVRHISTVLGPRPSIFLRLQLHALSTFPINWRISWRAGWLPTKLRPPYCSRCGHASWIPADRMSDSHQRATSGDPHTDLEDGHYPMKFITSGQTSVPLPLHWKGHSPYAGFGRDHIAISSISLQKYKGKLCISVQCPFKRSVINIITKNVPSFTLQLLSGLQYQYSSNKS